jgi:lysozyme family protein
MSFERAYQHTLQWEGGYANNPADKGGETYKGIARNFHPYWEGWDYIDNYKRKVGPIPWNLVIESPKLEQQVQEFYRLKLWDRHNLGQILHQDLAIKIFDMLVNHGRGSALVQQAVNEVGGQVKVDNFIGPNTVQAINSVSPTRLLNKLLDIRRAYYDQIVARDPSQRQFYKGWIARLESFDKKKA